MAGASGAIQGKIGEGRVSGWPLVAGGAIVAVLTLLAIFGPVLAPRDPLARTLVAEIDGQLRGVPFPPFRSWEFPLGSDRFGRDQFSRLLWAIRPTLLLVAIVAAVRLALGVLLGMAAGWLRGGLGRGLSLLIDVALAVPVLLVALAAITAVGIERGLLAFLVGFTLTGWAETAQSVRTQTRLVAARSYVQAARALGANGPQILIRHVGRQLAPLLAILLAFEIGAALLLAATLGFLGYFIGGGVWVITDGNYIPVAERVAGPPELGQLIGTAEIGLSSRPPWDLIFPGVVVVVAVLGFTLLGEGLRRRQEARAAPARSWLGRLLGTGGERLEEAVVTGAGALGERTAPLALGLLAALLLGVALQWWPADGVAATPPAPAVASTLPPQLGWSGPRGDPYGSLRGPPALVAPTVAWQFADPAGLVGGPAVAEDGTIYVAGAGGALHALAPDGTQRWSATIAGTPVGAPALGSDGTIYLADTGGGLYAFAPDGTERWRFQSSYRTEGSAGPVVGSDGTIYYALVDGVQAVAPDGTGRWVNGDRALPYGNFEPRLSPDGALVFLKDRAFSVADGARIALTVVPDQPRFADPLLLVGADGATYYRTEHRIVPWRRVEGGVAVRAPLVWPASNVLFLPVDAGVTARGVGWLLYASDFSDTRLVWMGPEPGQVRELPAPLRATRMIVVADDGTTTLCGTGRNNRLRCGAFDPQAGDEPRWELELGASQVVALGGAQVGQRLYIVTSGGLLYALE